MRSDGVHHVAIIVSDIERAKAFYTRALGLRVVREIWRAERGSWKVDLEGPGLALEVFTFPGAPARPSRPEAIGLRHLALRVESVERAVDELRSVGVPCEPVRTDPHTGKRFTFFADPDGLPLEVYEA